MKKKISIHDMAKGLHLSATAIESGQTQMQACLQGYIKAIEEGLCDPIIQKLHYKLNHQLGAEKSEQDFIQQHDRLDAIIFATDYLAINGLKAICNLKLSIPDDIAVVGFDDNKLFYLFTPSITAMAQPVEEISEEVVKQLPDALSDERESKKRRTVTLPIRPIERNSSLPKSKARAVMKKFEHKTKTVN
jgi:LacI family transcriptional regulator